MQKLKELIIDRIKDIYEIRALQSNQSNNYVQSPTKLQTETNNLNISLQISRYKCKEADRLKQQFELLIELNGWRLASETEIKQLIQHSIDICEAYDPEYGQFRTHQKEQNTLFERMQELYRSFFVQYGLKRRFRDIMHLLKRNLMQMTPSIYMGWLAEWSRTILCETYIEKKLIRKISIEKNQYLPENKNKIKKSVSEILFIHTKENFYGYFLNQLQSYYKNFDVLKLDQNFLKIIRRQGKKQDLLNEENINDAIKIFVEKKNKVQKTAINQYYQEYTKKMNMKETINKKIQIKENPQVNDRKQSVNIFISKKTSYNELQSLQFKNQIKIKKVKLMKSLEHNFKLEFPEVSLNSKNISHKKILKNPDFLHRFISLQGDRFHEDARSTKYNVYSSKNNFYKNDAKSSIFDQNQRQKQVQKEIKNRLNSPEKSDNNQNDNNSKNAKQCLRSYKLQKRQIILKKIIDEKIFESENCDIFNTLCFDDKTIHDTLKKEREYQRKKFSLSNKKLF